MPFDFSHRESVSKYGDADSDIADLDVELDHIILKLFYLEENGTASASSFISIRDIDDT
jgi:hypothetical protein